MWIGPLPAGSSRWCLLLAAFFSRHPMPTKVVWYMGEDGLKEAFSGSDLVIITAKIDDGKAESLCTAIAEHCPDAVVIILSNLESLLPIASEVFEKAGIYEREKLLGVALSKNDLFIKAGQKVSMGYAASIVTISCLRALNGTPDIAEGALKQQRSTSAIEVVLCTEEIPGGIICEPFAEWRTLCKENAVRSTETREKLAMYPEWFRQEQMMQLWVMVRPTLEEQLLIKWFEENRRNE